ncbi:hypothetical protein [Acetomicrobium sp.]|jgi:hypothetical protein|uniref:hypothetical protein n=1 Tax=Acetomicrobium sp. TaxID=1872099 RepID=UPI003D9752B5
MKIRLKAILAILAVFLFSAATAYAHTPILYVEDLKDGTIYVEGGFSDGSSAAGIRIYLVEDFVFEGNTSVRDEYLEALFASELSERAAYLEKLGCKIDGHGKDFSYSDLKPELFEKKLIIFQSQLDEHGELVLSKPEGKYLVVFDAGPGHVVVKQGPELTGAEKKSILNKAAKETNVNG